MVNDNADEVIEELFELLLSRYQIRLGTSIKGSDVVFVVFLLCLKCHEINLSRS